MPSLSTNDIINLAVLVVALVQTIIQVAFSIRNRQQILSGKAALSSLQMTGAEAEQLALQYMHATELASPRKAIPRDLRTEKAGTVPNLYVVGTHDYESIS